MKCVSVCTWVYPGPDLKLGVEFVGDPEGATDTYEVQSHAGDLRGVEDPVLAGNPGHHHVYTKRA